MGVYRRQSLLGDDALMGCLPLRGLLYRRTHACYLTALPVCVIRPYPQDGHPVVGFTAAPGLYVCTAHSGVTLAPYVAKLAAQEVGLAGRIMLLARDAAV